MTIRHHLTFRAGMLAWLALAAPLMAAFPLTAMAQTGQPTAAPTALPPPPDAATAPPPAAAATVPPPATATADQAPAAAPAAPSAASIELPQEPVENPYGLSALWKGGDFIARGTLLILAIMSMGTWYIMIAKIIDQTALFRQARAASRTFWTARTLDAGAQALGQKSAFRMLVEDGLRAAQHHEGTLTDQIDLHSWVTMSLQRSVDSINNRMQGGLAFLATVGSTAPFVGLFGTVWGIMHAFTSIAQSGDTGLATVAPGIAEALSTTAFGLVAAIPASIAYNKLASDFATLARRLNLAIARVARRLDQRDWRAAAE